MIVFITSTKHPDIILKDVFSVSVNNSWLTVYTVKPGKPLTTKSEEIQIEKGDFITINN